MKGLDFSVVHMDETRCSRAGSAHWIRAAISPELAVFSILPSRAPHASLDTIGTTPQGVVVSDRHAPMPAATPDGARSAGLIRAETSPALPSVPAWPGGSVGACSAWAA